MYIFFTKVRRKYSLVTADFKTVEKKFLAQGVDKDDVQKAFDTFKDLRSKNKLQGEEKNIDSWGKKSWKEFKEFVEKKKKTPTKSQDRKLARTKGADLVLEDQDWRIYLITSYEASKLYGSGTKWCISSNETDEQFKHYNEESHFYFLISKNRPSSDPFYKIALQITTENKATAWDATDKHHKLLVSLEGQYFIGEDVFFPKDFEYEIPEEARVFGGSRVPKKDAQKKLEALTPEDLKELLKNDNGVLKWIDDYAVVETYKNILNYAKAESKSLGTFLNNIEDGELLWFDHIEDSEIQNLLSEVVIDYRFEKILPKIAEEELRAFAKVTGQDIDDVKNDFASDPHDVLKRMLEEDLADELKSNLERAILDGWRAGTETNAWSEVKRFFTDTPSDIFSFLFKDEVAWLDSEVYLVVHLNEIKKDLSEIVLDGRDLDYWYSDQKPDFSYPRLDFDYDEKYAIDSFFDGWW